MHIPSETPDAGDRFRFYRLFEFRLLSRTQPTGTVNEPLHKNVTKGCWAYFAGRL